MHKGNITGKLHRVTFLYILISNIVYNMIKSEKSFQNKNNDND